MKTRATVLAATAALIGGAAAQEAAAPETARTYFAVGVQAGGEFEICDEDDDCATGGYGALGRYGWRANRFFGVEGEVGLTAFESDAFLHAAGLATLTLPLGPVDLRARGGAAVFSADDEVRFGGAFGPGIGVRTGERSALRADVLVFVGDDPSEGAGIDVGGLFQIAYERRF